MRPHRPRSSRNKATGIVLAAALFAAPPAQAIDPLDALVAAYPKTLSARDGNVVIFRDGTRIDAGAPERNKSFTDLLRDATIIDQFRLAYPMGALPSPPAPDFDPGRFRNEAFFSKMYGDCRKVALNLVSIIWLPKHWGHRIEVTPVNGVADRLAEVSAEIDALPPAIARAAYPIAGTYSCRPVRDTGRLSMHSYGAAIDLNLAFSDYWIWSAGQNARTVPYRNRMPEQIVAAFERRGFIWGGKWYHYDTMHFEYRPELLAPAAAPR
jgi:D-alanyl-D-alanine carboxypeptidase